jgi:hypothetical protein
VRLKKELKKEGTMKKILLILSIIGFVFNFIEAKTYNIQWGIGLRKFDLDTLLGIGIIALIIYLLLLLLKVRNRKITALILGSGYGFYKAINLYALSNGMLGLLSLFVANHTITITLTVIIVSLIISIFSKKKDNKTEKKLNF